MKHQHEPSPRFMRMRELTRTVGLSKSRIYDLERAGQFPTRIRLGANSVAWLEPEVRAWMNQRIAMRPVTGERAA